MVEVDFIWGELSQRVNPVSGEISRDLCDQWRLKKRFKMHQNCSKLGNFPDHLPCHHKFKPTDPFWHLMAFIKRSKIFLTRDIIPRWKLIHFCGCFPGIYKFILILRRFWCRQGMRKAKNLWINYKTLTCDFMNDFGREKKSCTDQPQHFPVFPPFLY